jgi:hypothetical protein
MANLTPFVQTLDSFLRGQLKGQEYKRNIEAEEAQRKLAQEQMMFERGIASGQLDVQRGNLATNRAKIGIERASKTGEMVREGRKDLVKRRDKQAEDEKGALKEWNSMRRMMQDTMIAQGYDPEISRNESRAYADRISGGKYGEWTKKHYGEYDTTAPGASQFPFATTEPSPKQQLAERKTALDEAKFGEQIEQNAFDRNYKEWYMENQDRKYALDLAKANGTITPPELQELRRLNLEKAKIELRNSMRKLNADPELPFETKEKLRSLYNRIEATEKDILINDSEKSRRISGLLQQISEIERGSGRGFFQGFYDSYNELMSLAPVIGSGYSAGDIPADSGTMFMNPATHGYDMPSGSMPPPIFVPGSSAPPPATSKSTGTKTAAPAAKPVVVEGVRPGAGGKSNGKKQNKTTSRSIRRVD